MMSQHLIYVYNVSEVINQNIQILRGDYPVLAFSPATGGN